MLRNRRKSETNTAALTQEKRHDQKGEDLVKYGLEVEIESKEVEEEVDPDHRAVEDIEHSINCPCFGQFHDVTPTFQILKTFSLNQKQIFGGKRRWVQLCF